MMMIIMIRIRRRSWRRKGSRMNRRRIRKSGRRESMGNGSSSRCPFVLIGRIILIKTELTPTDMKIINLTTDTITYPSLCGREKFPVH